MQIEKLKLKLQIKATGELFAESLENTGGHAKSYLLKNVALPLGLFTLGAGGIRKFLLNREAKAYAKKAHAEEAEHEEESWFQKLLPFAISFAKPIIISNLFRLLNQEEDEDEE